jgi:hypothetical protein
VRFEQFCQVFGSAPPGILGSRWHLWLNPRRRTHPGRQSESDSSEARPNARKNHHVEITGEKAFGEGNIRTKAAPPCAQINYSIPAARRLSSESTRNPSKGILVGGWFGDLRLG